MFFVLAEVRCALENRGRWSMVVKHDQGCIVTVSMFHVVGFCAAWAWTEVVTVETGSKDRDRDIQETSHLKSHNVDPLLGKAFFRPG